jgi:serine beta-lactamase-like protein LACTB
MKPHSFLAFVLASCVTLAAAASYDSIVPEVETVIQQEMRDWGITGISVALVDGEEIVYSKGFGDATRESIFRAGSISKLFNALAVMQQVENGNLHLDAPIPPTQLPINPFPEQPDITLRHLLSHRSGLQREAPVGGYLDDSEPGIRSTVESIRQSVLVTRPGEKTRYSNIAPTLAGHFVERTAGKSFEGYQQEHLLGPLGMNSSSWTIANTPKDRIIASHMRVADGYGGWIRRKAPLFDLGTIPAGNLFTTADDLARFAVALMKGGDGIVSPTTLKQMWTPQFTESDTGFGLGFVMGDFHGHRTVGHSGAVYGHSTSFILLPEDKIAVIVLGNEDIANGRIHRIQEAALTLMLNTKVNANLPPQQKTFAIDELSPFVGVFESESYWARIAVEGGKLVGDVSGQPTRFTPIGPLTFRADSRIHDWAMTRFNMDEGGHLSGFTMAGQTFTRVPDDPVPLPEEWRAVLGSYGLDFIPLILTERHGHLYAMTENMVDYRLTPVNRHVCSLPAGMYVDEEVVFLSDDDGTIRAIDFANMIFHRRD